MSDLRNRQYAYHRPADQDGYRGACVRCNEPRPVACTTAYCATCQRAVTGWYITDPDVLDDPDRKWDYWGAPETDLRAARALPPIVGKIAERRPDPYSPDPWAQRISVDLRALEELRRALQHAVAWCDPIGEGAPVRATPDALAQVNSAYLTICEVLEGE